MKLTDDHEAFRATVRRLVDERINPNADEWERAGMMPLHQIFKEMADLGMLGLEYDPKYGGQGADHSFTVVLSEEIGRCSFGSFGLALGVQVAMATPSLHAHGSDELKAKYLAPAMRGEMVAAVAVTEPDAGSDVASLRTRARRDGDDWVINGSKMFITNSLQADWICTLVRTSDEGGYKGMSQILVPTDTTGFSVAKKLDKLGMRASDTGLLSFDDMRVPVANTIGEIGRGFQQQMTQFQNERMIAAYMAVGGMDRALSLTAAYLRDRQTFGAPLLSRQYVQFRLAELAADLDTLRHYNYSCAEAYIAGQDTTRFATIAKLKAGRLHREIADTCLQFHGGFGYMEESWVSRYFRDSRLMSIGGGSDEVMLQILARLDGFTG
jgi:citronellyl-CoA dehydrogenase